MPSPTKSIPEALAELPQPIGLLGFGVEGRATLRFLRGQGVAEVRVFDRAFGSPSPEDAAEFPDVRFCGEEDPLLTRCGTIFRSPGVRPDLPALRAASGAGARLTSATALFLALRPCRVAGVTGTVGKGTTASLIGEALSAAGIPHRLGGNIGLNPLEFLAELTPGHVAVLELSSFQLMDLDTHQPDVAVILRTSSEHLDWHRDVAEYRAAKGRLLRPEGSEGNRQTVIYCADSEGSRGIVTGREALKVSLEGPVANGIGEVEGQLLRFRGGTGERLPVLEELVLPGRFNRENAAAAFLATEALGGEPAKFLPAIAAFPGLPHRLEQVGRIGAILCYNDSYATRPDATLAALNTFEEPLAVILGGSEKGADFAPLAEGICRRRTLRAAVLMGATAERIGGEIAAAAGRLGRPAPPVERAGSLEEAFRLARKALPEGGVLLFSPACASFDMFSDYKVRGERFRSLVEGAQQK